MRVDGDTLDLIKLALTGAGNLDVNEGIRILKAKLKEHLVEEIEFVGIVADYLGNKEWMPEKSNIHNFLTYQTRGALKKELYRIDQINEIEIKENDMPGSNREIKERDVAWLYNIVAINERTPEDEYLYEELYELVREFVGQDWMDCIQGKVTRKELAEEYNMPYWRICNIFIRKVSNLIPWLHLHGYEVSYLRGRDDFGALKKVKKV